MRNVLIFLLFTVIFIIFFAGQLSQSQVETEKFHFVVRVLCLHESTKNEIENAIISTVKTTLTYPKTTYCVIKNIPLP